MLDYQRQTSNQTLSEGIREYYRAHQELTSRKPSPQGEAFFRCHDVVHVVFGCDISLQDEAVVKVSSFLGTTGGTEVMKGYRLPESREIYGDLRLSEILLTTTRSLLLVPRTIWRCWRMTDRWPWSDFEGHLNTSLRSIREHYGITVAHRDPGTPPHAP